MARLRFPDKPAPPPHMTLYLEESAKLPLPNGIRLTQEIPAYRAAPPTKPPTEVENKDAQTKTQNTREASGLSPTEETGETPGASKR